MDPPGEVLLIAHTHAEDHNIFVKLTVPVILTAQKSPAVNTTKRDSQQAQLQPYLLECLL